MTKKRAAGSGQRAVSVNSVPSLVRNTRRKIAKLAFGVIAACAVAVAVFAWRRHVSLANAPARHVILISIDTLRSDHLPAYGYKGVQTPNLDALRRDSILFERAYSQVPLTLPSHVSILTGELPADNGVHDNIGFRLGDAMPTLPALLKQRGFATGGAVSAFVLRHETGIARGFDVYDDDVESQQQDATTPALAASMQRSGRDTVKAIEKWIDGVGTKPFFAFVHLYEPHAPYDPPEPYYSRYPNHYDGEIAYSDAVVGDLLEYLKQKNLYDDSLIVFLSDHGEGLNDHGEEEHGIFLYREALQVPLMVKLPHRQRRGETVAAPVALVDVFPTILERTGTPLPQNAKHDGQSLVTKLDSNRSIYAESYYARFHFGWSDLHSLISGSDHYIRAPQPELYDLASDPGEKKNTFDKNRRAVARMRDAIEPFVREAAAPENISAEEAAKLAALGYVGSTVDTRPGAALPDPKTTIGVYQQIRLAFAQYRGGEEAKALQLTKQLLASNPEITDLWDLECKIYNKLGDPRGGLEAAKEGLHHAPSSIALLFDVANQAFALNDLDTAEQHAEIAARIEPGEGHQLLSRIAARRGDLKTATSEAELSVQSSADATGSLMLLADYSKQAGDLNAALQYLDRAAERVARRSPPRQPQLHLDRGDVLARLGRNAEAEQEFRAEIADYPKTAEAYSALMILMVGQRRLNEGTGLVFELLKAAPEPHSYVVIAETLAAIGDDRGAMFWAGQGLQKFPADPTLRALPERLQRTAAAVRKQLGR